MRRLRVYKNATVGFSDRHMDSTIALSEGISWRTSIICLLAVSWRIFYFDVAITPNPYCFFEKFSIFFISVGMKFLFLHRDKSYFLLLFSKLVLERWRFCTFFRRNWFSLDTVYIKVFVLYFIEYHICVAAFVKYWHATFWKLKYFVLYDIFMFNVMTCDFVILFGFRLRNLQSDRSNFLMRIYVNFVHCTHFIDLIV